MTAIGMSPDSLSRQPLDISHFERRARALDPDAIQCREQIAELRSELDAACDAGYITVAEWRDVLGRLAELQCRLQRQMRST